MSSDERPPVELTFETAFTRLEAIAARLNEVDVPVAEIADLLDEGKSLERALTAYLEQLTSRIEQIEQGQGSTRVVIVNPGGADPR